MKLVGLDRHVFTWQYVEVAGETEAAAVAVKVFTTHTWNLPLATPTRPTPYKTRPHALLTVAFVQ